MSDFDTLKFRQLMLKYYKELEIYGFGNEAIEQLRAKESAVIDFANQYNNDSNNTDKISEEDVLPVIPDMKKLNNYLSAIKKIFPAFVNQGELCDDHSKKKKKMGFSGHENLNLEFFKDIPDIPKDSYFVVIGNRYHDPANPAHLRKHVDNSKEAQDGFFTMLETFSYIVFAGSEDMFRDIDRLFIMNSILGETEDRRIILCIYDKSDKDMPRIYQYIDCKNLPCYQRGGDGGMYPDHNIAYWARTRI